jgi:starvation-inducible DNA-binding protein
MSDKLNTYLNDMADEIAVLLASERELISMASENDDEGTASLMSGFIGEQEKLMWMLKALLK